MSQPSEPESLSRQKLTRKQRRKQQLSISQDNDASDTIVQSIDSLQITLQMSAPIRLLVCSIGNPGSYINTLHSAGHTVLSALASSLSYPSWQRSRAYGNGLVSAGPEFTLWQSTSLMNESGTGVAAAWRQFVKEGRGQDARLIVVHDELELALGQVKVKSGTASAKGHNGLKSINGLLRGADYTRIGVGIGRPESRDANIVAAYVLRKMSGVERGRIEACAGKVEMELRGMMG